MIAISNNCVPTRSTTCDSPADRGTTSATATRAPCLLEAFAYLTEMLLYRVNRVPEKARHEFLGLLGVAVTAPAAAAATLQLDRSDGASGPIDVPAGHRVTARGSTGADAVDFITDAAAHIEADQASTTVRAHQCEQVDGELIGISNGEAGQQFALAQAPVVLATGHELDLVIGVEATIDELADVLRRPPSTGERLRSGCGRELRGRRARRFVGRAVPIGPAAWSASRAAVRLPTDGGGLAEHPIALAARFRPPAVRSVRGIEQEAGRVATSQPARSPRSTARQ